MKRPSLRRAALEQLGVGEPKAYAYLSDAQRDRRPRLRAYGRQFGDLGDAGSEAQAVDLLTQEVAYQHWRRRLFARWLAENQPLMVPAPVAPAAGTLEECAELAAAATPWAWCWPARTATRPPSPHPIKATLPAPTIHEKAATGWSSQPVAESGEATARGLSLQYAGSASEFHAAAAVRQRSRLNETGTRPDRRVQSLL